MKKWNPDIKMELNHRDIEIFKKAIKPFMREVKKNSRIEHLVGSDAYSELYDYCRELHERLENAANPVAEYP